MGSILARICIELWLLPIVCLEVILSCLSHAIVQLLWKCKFYSSYQASCTFTIFCINDDMSDVWDETRATADLREMLDAWYVLSTCRSSAII